MITPEKTLPFFCFQLGFKSSCSTADLPTVVFDKIVVASLDLWLFGTWYTQSFWQDLAWNVLEFLVGYLAFIHHFLSTDGFDCFCWMGSLPNNIQLMLLFFEAPFLVLPFSYYTLMIFLVILFIMLLSISIILLSSDQVFHLWQELMFASEIDLYDT